MGLLVFDAVLVLLIIALAGGAMFCRQLPHAVMLFIAFGLMMALAWARLAAPDLALAEAAIGAGLTGALCFTALARYQIEDQSASAHQPTVKLRRFMPLLFVAAVVMMLLFSFWQIPAVSPSLLPALVNDNLAQSGVSHPVTAVLLNFRAWDTLLELLVLLLALLGAQQSAVTLPVTKGWSLSIRWSKQLSPLLILVTGYVLWRGAAAPGGAFQAGALLASGAVILRLNQQLPWLSWQNLWIRLLSVSGLFAFVLSGGLALWLSSSANWLAWPTAVAGALILVIEAFATLAIAVTLTLLVVGEPAPVEENNA